MLPGIIYNLNFGTLYAGYMVQLKVYTFHF